MKDIPYTASYQSTASQFKQFSFYLSVTKTSPKILLPHLSKQFPKDMTEPSVDTSS